MDWILSETRLEDTKLLLVTIGVVAAVILVTGFVFAVDAVFFGSRATDIVLNFRCLELVRGHRDPTNGGATPMRSRDHGRDHGSRARKKREDDDDALLYGSADSGDRHYHQVLF